MSVKRLHTFMREIEEDILKFPWTCDCCGKVETKGDIFLKYDNDMIMCDDCAFNFYLNQEKQNNPEREKGE